MDLIETFLNQHLGYKKPQTLAVALSGGPDSLCLTLVAQKWAKVHGIKLIALTVDHGLRKESFKEAQIVARWMAEFQIEHHILPWLGEKPTSRIQEQARAERYRLLINWCQSNGVKHLLLGHNFEDQLSF